MEHHVCERCLSVFSLGADSTASFRMSKLNPTHMQCSLTKRAPRFGKNTSFTSPADQLPTLGQSCLETQETYSAECPNLVWQTIGYTHNSSFLSLLVKRTEICLWKRYAQLGRMNHDWSRLSYHSLPPWPAVRCPRFLCSRVTALCTRDIRC